MDSRTCETSQRVPALLTFFEWALLILCSIFLGIGVYWKLVTKIVFVAGLLVYLAIRFLRKPANPAAAPGAPSPLNVPVLVFIFFALISVITSRHVNVSQEIFFQRYLLYFGFFMFGAYVARKQRNVTILVVSFIAGALFASIGGMIDTAKDASFHALRTSFGLNCLSTSYFLYVFSFMLAYAVFCKVKYCRIATLLILFPILYCFLFMYSRSGWLSLMLGILCSFTVLKLKRVQPIFVVAFICLAIIVMPAFRVRLFSPLTLQPLTWGDRVPMWTAALKMFLAHPLVGNGLGSYGIDMYTIIDPSLYTEGRMHAHAHNQYLEILAEMGIGGLLSFLFIFVQYFRTAVRRLRAGLDCAGVAIFLLTVSVLVNELTASTILVGFYPPALFWFFMGMSQARAENTEQRTV